MPHLFAPSFRLSSRSLVCALGSVAALACSAASAQFLSVTTMQPQVVFAAKSTLPAPSGIVAGTVNVLCIPPAAGGDTCGIVRYKGVRLVPHTPIMGQASRNNTTSWQGNSIVWIGYDRNNVRTNYVEVPFQPAAYSLDRLPNLNPVVRSSVVGEINEPIAERFVPSIVAPQAIPNFALAGLNNLPPDLKACSYSGTAASTGSCPALNFYGNLLVPFSFKDNRMASRLVGFDSQRNVMYTFELPNVRYINAVEVNAQAQVVTFTGQDNQKAIVSFYDLPYNAPLPNR